MFIKWNGIWKVKTKNIMEKKVLFGYTTESLSDMLKEKLVKQSNKNISYMLYKEKLPNQSNDIYI